MPVCVTSSSLSPRASWWEYFRRIRSLESLWRPGRVQWLRWRWTRWASGKQVCTSDPLTCTSRNRGMQLWHQGYAIYYCIVGNFRERKLSWILQFMAICEFFFVKFESMVPFGTAKVSNLRKFSPKKSCFSPILKKFSSSKVSHYTIPYHCYSIWLHIDLPNIYTPAFFLRFQC